MAKQSFKRKKAWQKACRESAAQGMINKADGGMSAYRRGDEMQNSMVRDFFQGYKVGEKVGMEKKKKGKK